MHLRLLYPMNQAVSICPPCSCNKYCFPIMFLQLALLVPPMFLQLTILVLFSAFNYIGFHHVLATGTVSNHILTTGTNGFPHVLTMDNFGPPQCF